MLSFIDSHPELIVYKFQYCPYSFIRCRSTAFPDYYVHRTSIPIYVKSQVKCLLYADERHSLSLGYRWNPSKHIILTPDSGDSQYALHGQVINKA